MRLAEDEARRRLAAYNHGVLGTTHRDRGADLVPVVFAIDGDHVAIPIDTVKPKSAGRLWWVRARLTWLRDDVESLLAESLSKQLTTKYEAYAAAPFARLLVFRIDDVSGWLGASSGR